MNANESITLNPRIDAIAEAENILRTARMSKGITNHGWSILASAAKHLNDELKAMVADPGVDDDYTPTNYFNAKGVVIDRI